MKYRFGGKERRLAFGTYPEISLADARDMRDDAKRLLKQGRDPAHERKQEANQRRKAEIICLRLSLASGTNAETSLETGSR